MSEIAQTPDGVYYAVIFTSQRTPGDDGYADMADRMEQLAADQPGFLGIESARGADGFGISVSYWRSLEELQAWKRVQEHRVAQRRGREQWYQKYQVRVARLEYEYGMPQASETRTKTASGQGEEGSADGGRSR